MKWCRLRDYSRLRAHPFGAAAGLRPTAFNLGCAQVVEPDFSYVGGSTNMPSGAKLLSNNFFEIGAG